MTCCDCCPTDPFVWPLSVVQTSFRHCLCKIGHTFSAYSIRLYEDNQCTLPPVRTHTYTSSISSSIPVRALRPFCTPLEHLDLFPVRCQEPFPLSTRCSLFPSPCLALAPS
ncbi:uncharacterized protein BT62DRAFT_225309 [Guyanagaster necrorhizus]|uniref:Uncharacterized protein n=1 Tax=Guyanagaster necrorhizus TaxID=856835 RepID=A0A9P7VQC0_9AGAR|nr:uncharacterized protein BT62DRAFT_225309 [Guyanagaster necrorhizus MCA 3950]KAG7444745.1 hypothetical protein BT62DRAFT_225309 [Guyanagaster necrorhizus MCA 3950]